MMHATARQDSPSRFVHRSTTSSRILLVSEASTERARYVDALTANGYCTLLAATAETACRLASELELVAVIVTVKLSVCADGVPLGRRLKQEAHLAGVPIVIVEDRSNSGHELEHVGCDLFVARPRSPAAIAPVIAGLLRQRQTGEERRTKNKERRTATKN